MTREDIIRMAREVGIDPESDTLCNYGGWVDTLVDFSALVVAAEREALEKEWPVKFASVKAFEDWCASIRSNEREACAKVAGWLWQQFQDIKDAHERNSMEPFVPGQFGFDQSTVQQSKRMMDAIRARGQA